MKKTVIILVVLFISNMLIKAQDVLTDQVFIKQTTLDKKAIPYQYLREADVLWSKIVWRTIELKEKINLPLYFPLQAIGDRKSLIDVLLYAIQNQGLTAYGESANNEFSNTLTVKDIEERFGVKSDTFFVDDVSNPGGPPIKRVADGTMNTSEVKQYILKELWYFDKQRSKLEVRIIGICPVRVYSKETTEDAEMEGPESLFKKKLFWVYFPEARNILANQEVFNPYNDKESRSFDDIFQNRMFSSYIIQESNVFSNRSINDYTSGLGAMQESDRIAQTLYNTEQNLWEY